MMVTNICLFIASLGRVGILWIFYHIRNTGSLLNFRYLLFINWDCWLASGIRHCLCSSTKQVMGWWQITCANCSAVVILQVSDLHHVVVQLRSCPTCRFSEWTAFHPPLSCSSVGCMADLGLLVIRVNASSICLSVCLFIDWLIDWSSGIDKVYHKV